METRYRIADIKRQNAEAGQHFFERSTMRFFDSRIESQPYHGPGGIYFITSEQFHGSQGSAPRKYTIRQFNPENGHVWTASEFNKLDCIDDAREAARSLAGEVKHGTSNKP